MDVLMKSKLVEPRTVNLLASIEGTVIQEQWQQADQ